VVSAAVLAEALWDASPPPNAPAVMRTYVARLRRALGPAGARIAGQPPGWAVEFHGPEEFDLAEVDALWRTARGAAGAGEWGQVSSLLARALSLWRGEPLVDVPSAALARREAGRLAELWLQLTEARIDADLRLGRHGELVAGLRRLAAEHPLREHIRVQLMLACYRCGQQGAALEVYRDARRTLAGELGVEPGPELREMHQKILAADPGLTAADPARLRIGQSGGDYPRQPVPRQLPPAAGHFTVRAAALHQQMLAADPVLNVAEPAAPAAGTPVPPVPRGLPAAPAHFTGRSAELRALTRLLDRSGEETPGTVVISAIGGTAGVGKTALAVRWAHQVAGRFPDGQLYVNLRGFDPSGAPAAPSEAIRGFLDALGVPANRIPAGLAGQASLYRSLLAGRQVLIVLDNARDEAQVRPLVPASPGCLVIVTSRNQLTGLAATEGASLLTIDVFPEAEARQMLSVRLGTKRAASDPEAVAEITALCTRLPLALAVAAARAAGRPRFPLAALAAELRSAGGRLDALDTGDPAASVRAVFSWSSQLLSSSAARLFRLLALHPGPGITAGAAASLAGAPAAQARRDLTELTRACLLTEHTPGRYAFHDLLRTYAAEQAETTDDAQTRHTATGRLLDHYLHTAHTAALLLTPAREQVALAAPRPGVTPGHLTDSRQALTWFETENRVLLASVTLATETGFDSHAWQLPQAMAGFLSRRGQWHEKAAIQRTAVAAAARLGDIAGQAISIRLLASACATSGTYAQARAHLTECLKLYRQLGNRTGQARVHQDLSWVTEHQGHHDAALGHAKQALQLFQAAGHQAGQGAALNAIGWCHALLGDYERARPFSRRALALNHELGNRQNEAAAWDSLGYAEHRLGNLTDAAACYQQALSTFREVGDRFSEAEILTHLGDNHLAAGEPQEARDAWQKALSILDDLRHPDVSQIRARLSAST
jgi:DNA-binding SARP family transcriptional activator